MYVCMCMQVNLLPIKLDACTLQKRQLQSMHRGAPSSLPRKFSCRDDTFLSGSHSDNVERYSLNQFMYSVQYMDVLK
jgi:hypothetical protein